MTYRLVFEVFLLVIDLKVSLKYMEIIMFAWFSYTWRNHTLKKGLSL